MRNPKFLFVLSLMIAELTQAKHCVPEGANVPIFVNAPTCCEGLEFKRPDTQNLGFAGVCIKSSDRVPSNQKQVLENSTNVEKKMTLFNQSHM